MDRIIKIFERLLKPRTLIMLALIGTFCWCIVMRRINTATLIGAINVLMGFYFGEKMSKNNKDNPSVEIENKE